MGLRQLALAAAALICAGDAAFSQNSAPIPNFAPDGITGWIMDRSVTDDFKPPASGPGPVTFDKAHPYVPNGRAEPASFRIADVTNPNLKPWAVEQMKKSNADVLAGKFAFTPKSTCWPASVPGVLLLNFEPMYIIQTPKVVWMIWEYDNQVRRIYLNQKHTPNVKPSWYGESVGHYEGDTLVVDTVGISDKTYVDDYRTPHTDQLHVVERFRMINGGRVLEVDFTVEDPGTFNMAWSAKQIYNRTPRRAQMENICAENVDLFAYEKPPSPEAQKPDF